MSKKIKFTYEDQIKYLENKELVISDPESAKASLKKIGFSSLIDCYDDLFEHRPSGNYLYGTSFEEITAMYHFDETLRDLFLKNIQSVEIRLKSIVSACFREEYGKVPLWVATSVLSFGQLSKVYQNASSDIRSAVSHNFDKTSETQLHSFIRILSACKNICEHDEILYSFKVNEAISDTVIHSKMQLPQNNGQYSVGKHDLFAVVIALRYLLDKSSFIKFKKELKKSITSVLNNCPHISRDILFSEMGFPENWTDITRYKI